jgi:hypothetical protein
MQRPDYGSGFLLKKEIDKQPSCWQPLAYTGNAVKKACGHINRFYPGWDLNAYFHLQSCRDFPLILSCTHPLQPERSG